MQAANDALDDAGLEWKDVQLIAGGETVRNGYPGYVSGASFAQALGWTGAPVVSSYGACARFAPGIRRGLEHVWTYRDDRLVFSEPA